MAKHKISHKEEEYLEEKVSPGIHKKIKKLEKKKTKPKEKVEKVLHEYKEGTLHSGSKKGPKVKKRSQAIAIAMSEARRANKKNKSSKKKK